MRVRTVGRGDREPTISLNQQGSEVPGSCVADLALRLAFIRQVHRSANQEAG